MPAPPFVGHAAHMYAASTVGGVVTLDAVFGTPTPNVVLSNGNLTVKRNASGGTGFVRATKAIPPAGAFWEYTWDSINGSFSRSGIVDSSHATPAGLDLGEDTSITSTTVDNGGARLYNAGRHGTGQAAFTPGQTVLFLYSSTRKLQLFFPAGGGWNNGGGFDPAGGQDVSATMGATVYPGASVTQVNDQGTFNFGAGGRASFVNTAAYDTLIAAGYKSLQDA